MYLLSLLSLRTKRHCLQCIVNVFLCCNGALVTEAPRSESDWPRRCPRSWACPHYLPSSHLICLFVCLQSNYYRSRLNSSNQDHNCPSITLLKNLVDLKINWNNCCKVNGSKPSAVFNDQGPRNGQNHSEPKF